MNFPDKMDDIRCEQRRRLFALFEPDSQARLLWSCAIAALPNDVVRNQFDQGFGFAKGIEYRHVGVKSETYFSNPIRIAGIATLISSAQ
jgi:hypothetical protein